MAVDIPRENMIFTLCNPLLDISASAPDSMLTKYNLVANNAILAENTHMPLYVTTIRVLFSRLPDHKLIARGSGLHRMPCCAQVR